MQITEISVEVDEAVAEPGLGVSRRVRVHAAVADGESVFEAARELAAVVAAQREQAEARRE